MPTASSSAGLWRRWEDAVYKYTYTYEHKHTMSKRDSEHPQHDHQKPVPDLRARLRLHARRDAGDGSDKAGFGRVGMRVFHSVDIGAHLRRVFRAPRIHVPRLRVPRRLS